MFIEDIIGSIFDHSLVISITIGCLIINPKWSVGLSRFPNPSISSHTVVSIAFVLNKI